MECNLSRTLIALGKNELAPEDSVALSQHLAGCSTCAQAANKLQQFDARIGEAMRAVPVPTGLHESLLKTAFAARGAILRRRVYQTAMLAASLIIAIGLIYGGYWRSRPELDTNALAVRTELEQERREQAAREWLATHHLPAKLPYEFDFRLCLFYGKEELAGRDVPVIVFSNGRDTAKLYFVRKNQFKTEDARFAKSSLCTVEVHASADPDIVFVVTYTTEKLDPFLLRRAIGPIA